MSNAITTRSNVDMSIVESVMMVGDLARLTPEQRVAYYNAVCNSLGLNPLTRPFDYINLSGKLTLYARKDATDQLRKAQRISVALTRREFSQELGTYTVEVEATTPDGRRDFATGVVSVKSLSGDAMANAQMKAETKAKRRATLSICGLGWTDETEIETIPNAVPVVVDDTGAIVEPPKPVRPEPPKPESKSDSRPVRPVTNGDTPSPDKLLKAVNVQTGGYYQNVNHLFNALKGEISGFTWPVVTDKAAWDNAQAAAVDHFMKQKPAEPKQDEIPF